MRSLFLIAVLIMTLSGCTTMQMVAGGVTSVAVHTAGHIVVMEAMDKDWHLDGRIEVVDTPTNDSEKRWIGRSGFLLQLGVEYLLNRYWPNSAFVKGYNIGTFLEVSTYPLRDIDEGDLDWISHGANADLEWAAYTAAAAWPLTKPWRNDGN